MSTTLLVTGLLAAALAREPPTFPGLMSIDKLVDAGGYKATNIEVMTEDGYSLWLHRLGNNTGPPVLLQHGILVSADSWISRTPKKSLPFVLLEHGFDVWLSNQRGTACSEYSLKNSKDEPKFWDFSFHESGYYDLPAFIDTILEKRGKKKLFYIGHSLGTTVYLVMTSLRPEYNSKVQAAIFLSPVAYSPPEDEMSPFVRFMSRNAETIYGKRNDSYEDTYLSEFLQLDKPQFDISQHLTIIKLSDLTRAQFWIKPLPLEYDEMMLNSAGQYYFGRRTVNTVNFLKNHCRFGSSTEAMCLTSMGLMIGNDWNNVDPKEWNFHVPYFLSGTSLKTLYHAMQIYQIGNFRQFNYGPEINMMNYNSTVPAKYNVSLVTTPVAMFWSYNDPLLSKTSVKNLASQLPNLIFTKAIPDSSFSHIDMFIGKQAENLLYPDILQLLKSLS